MECVSFALMIKNIEIDKNVSFKADRQKTEKIMNKIIKIVGNQRRIARALDVSPERICHWLNRDRSIPAEHVLDLEELTGGKVTRYQMRPDVFLSSSQRQRKRRRAA